MTEPANFGPQWVVQRDGRRVPFEADAIGQALFAATEALGRPNAFLAREMADAVLHFLVQEDDEAPTTTHIAELVGKVVRELDQPALAQAFAVHLRRRHKAAADERPEPITGQVAFTAADAPGQVVQECLRAYSLQAVYARDLAAAERDGLLAIGGLDAPGLLASVVVDTRSARGDLVSLGAALHQAAMLAGRCVVLDGPEWLPLGGADAAQFVRMMRAAPTWMGRTIVVNANSVEPPAWAQRSGEGPLFAPESGEAAQAERQRWLDALSADRPSEGWHLNWHLSAADFQAGPAKDRLVTVAEGVRQGWSVTFAFDRPRRPVALAEGMERGHPGVLLAVGLDLPAFLAWDDVAGDGAVFLDKLPSLARMAVSVATQKRKFLRTRADNDWLGRGFLLDRARTVVVPLGLDAVVQTLTGVGPTESVLALETAQQIVQTLNRSLRAAGLGAHLDVVLDAAGPHLEEPPMRSEATPKQLQALGLPSAVVRMSADEEIVDWLHAAWKRTEMVRVRFE